MRARYDRARPDAIEPRRGRKSRRRAPSNHHYQRQRHLEPVGPLIRQVVAEIERRQRELRRRHKRRGR